MARARTDPPSEFVQATLRTAHEYSSLPEKAFIQAVADKADLSWHTVAQYFRPWNSRQPKRTRWETAHRIVGALAALGIPTEVFAGLAAALTEHDSPPASQSTGLLPQLQHDRADVWQALREMDRADKVAGRWALDKSERLIERYEEKQHPTADERAILALAYTIRGLAFREIEYPLRRDPLSDLHRAYDLSLRLSHTDLAVWIRGQFQAHYRRYITDHGRSPDSLSELPAPSDESRMTRAFRTIEELRWLPTRFTPNDKAAIHSLAKELEDAAQLIKEIEQLSTVSDVIAADRFERNDVLPFSESWSESAAGYFLRNLRSSVTRSVAHFAASVSKPYDILVQESKRVRLDARGMTDVTPAVVDLDLAFYGLRSRNSSAELERQWGLRAWFRSYRSSRGNGFRRRITQARNLLSRQDVQLPREMPNVLCPHCGPSTLVLSRTDEQEPKTWVYRHKLRGSCDYILHLF